MAEAAIIGGGACGLLCALRLKELLGENAEVTVFERNSRLGKKIAQSGNGKGNLTNVDTNEKYYNNPSFAREVLKKWDSSRLRAYFYRLGILTKNDEEGRVYPYCESAAGFLDVIRARLYQEGVSIVNEYVDFLMPGTKFAVGIRRFDYAIVSIGSVAGTNEKRNRLYGALQEMGHTLTPLTPALAPLASNNPYLPSFAGVRVKAKGSLYIENRLVKEEKGEFIFKPKAISGIAAFNLASYLARYAQKGKANGAYVTLDLFPDYSLDKLTETLRTFIDNCATNLTEALAGTLNKMIAQAAIKELGKIMLTKNESEKAAELAKILKGWRFFVFPSKDVANAQVISGGVAVKDVDPTTLESKKVPNLYFGGEVLDIDGLSGGYNLHFAFACGLTIAESIARKINAENERNDEGK